MILLLLISSSLGGYAQEDKTPRPKESDIIIEKLFIEANREKILGNIDEAIHLYLEVLQKDNNNGATNYELARLYKRQNQYDKALLRAEKSMDLEPYNLLYAELYAFLLDKESNYKKLIELYASLCTKYSTNEDLHYNWGYFLTKIDKADQAIKVYNNLEKEVGVKEGISLRKYKLYQETGKEKKAGQELERLAAAYPNEVEYTILLARFYIVTDFNKSQELYLKALKIDPNHPAANLAMAQSFLHSGDTAKYLKTLIASLEDSHHNLNQNLETLRALVNELSQGKLASHQNAILELSNKLVQINPQSASAAFLNSEILYSQKKYKEAAQGYLKAVPLLKNDLVLWEHLLESLYQSYNNKELQTKSNEMLEMYPNQAISFYYYGLGLFQQEKYSQAEKELKQAIDIATTNPELQEKAMRVLAKVYLASRQIDKANKTFNDCLVLMPNNLATINDYAFFIAKQNSDLPKAAKLVKEILEKEAQNPVFITTNAYILFRQGKFSAAEIEINKALDLGANQNPEALECAGDIQLKLGKESEAIKYWQKALDKSEPNSALTEKISTKKINE